MRSLASRLLALLLLPVLPALSACGGGGGGGRAVPGDASSKASVEFPGALAMTDAEAIVVRGTASDLDGVVSITIGGVAATSSNGFANWQALLPLANGRNAFDVAVRDRGGRVTSGLASLEVESEPARAAPNSIAFDAARNRLLFSDSFTQCVIALDLATGDCRFFSDATHGAGTPLDEPAGIALDAANDRLYVVEHVVGGAHALLAVDLATGDRSLLSGLGVGSGSDFDFPDDVAIDSARSRLLVTERDRGIVAVDLATGNRSLMSGTGVGTGPAFDLPICIGIAPSGSFAIVGDIVLDALVRVELTTGNRSIVSDATNGTGPLLKEMRGIHVRADELSAIVCDTTLDAVLEVNLSNGDRTVLCDNQTGTGPSLSSPFDAVELDASGDLVAFLDGGLATALVLDVATGVRADLSDDNTGEGDPLQRGTDVALDASRRRAIVSDERADTILEIDLTTGDRTLVSGALRGAGPDLDRPIALALDLARDRAIVITLDAAGTAGQLMTVSLTSGDRVVLSGGGAGSGPLLESVADVVVDPALGRAIVADSHVVAGNRVGRLIAVDLDDGARTIVTDEANGSGPAILSFTSITRDPARNRILGLDPFQNLVLAVDLATGDRTIVSGDTVGSGPPLDASHLTDDPAGDRIITVSNDRPFQLHAIDLASGDRALLYDEAFAAGPPFSEMLAMESADSGGVIFVLEEATNALVCIDPASAQHVVVSQ